MHRSAPRLVRLLASAASAAVPVMLVAGCSSGSEDASAEASPATPTASASASPALAAAKYTKLPQSCAAISQKTVKSLVPKVKSASGTDAKSSDADARGGCSWNGLDGFQYRWLDVSFMRFDSAVGIGSAEEQAVEAYDSRLAEAKQAKGATTTAATGLGDAATTVTVTVEEDKEEYQDVTAIARTGNVVVVLSYKGAGFEDAKTPKASDIRAGALTAVKEAVTAASAVK